MTTFLNVLSLSSVVVVVVVIVIVVVVVIIVVVVVVIVVVVDDVVAYPRPDPRCCDHNIHHQTKIMIAI